MSDRLAQLEKLHAADPKDPFCTYGIALEHAKAGRHGDALAWLDKTLAADPRYCYAYYQKAKVLSETGKGEDAKAVLRDGMKAAQDAGDAHAHSEMVTQMESME